LAAKCSRAEREVYTVTAGRRVTLRGLGHVMLTVLLARDWSL